MNARRFGLSLLSFSAIAGVVGCGGGGSNDVVLDDGIQIAAGVHQTTVPTTAEIPASTTSQTVKIGGSDVLVPASTTSYPAGELAVVIPNDVSLLSGARPAEALTRSAPYDVTIKQLPNGPTTVYENILNSNGSLKQKIGLLTGDWQVDVGAWSWGDVRGNVVTCKHYTFKVSIREGHSSYPIVAGGILPRNGGGTNSETYLWSHTDGYFAGVPTTLTVISGGVTKSKTVNIGPAGGALLQSYTKFDDVMGSIPVPTTGVDQIIFDLVKK